MQESFIFYRSFYESIKCLPESEQNKVYGAIMEYSLNGVETETDGAAKALFLAFKPQIEANIKRRENGFKGGKPQSVTEPKPNDNQNITKETPNVNVNSNVNDNYNDNGNVNDNYNDNVSGVDTVTSRTSFEIPTLTLITPKEKIYFNEEQITEYGKLYPGVDIAKEIAKMQENINGMKKCHLYGENLSEFIKRWFARSPVFEENIKKPIINIKNNNPSFDAEKFFEKAVSKSMGINSG